MLKNEKKKYNDCNRSTIHCVYRYIAVHNSIFRITPCFVKNVSIASRHARTNQDITLIRNKKKIFKSLSKSEYSAQMQFVCLAEPSVITTSTDAREWKDRSSKRQIDMSSIRHDGRVLSSQKRYARTHICHVRIRTCVYANFAVFASAPSLFARAYFVCSVHMYACTRARLVAYIIVRLISVINILRTAITRVRTI